MAERDCRVTAYQQLQAFIAAENPDTGEVEVVALGHSSVHKARAFVDDLNDNPVNDWSGDTPAVVVVAFHPSQVLNYLETNFQVPRTRGAKFINMAGLMPAGPAPAPA